MLLEERQKLHAAWQHKKVYLDQLIDLHFFMRDAKQIENISNTQEVCDHPQKLKVSICILARLIKITKSFGSEMESPIDLTWFLSLPLVLSL